MHAFLPQAALQITQVQAAPDREAFRQHPPAPRLPDAPGAGWRPRWVVGAAQAHARWVLLLRQVPCQGLGDDGTAQPPRHHCRCRQHQRQLSAPSRPTAERRPARSAGGHAWGQVHPRWGHCRLGAGPRWWVLPRRRPPKQTASWAVPARRVPQSAGHTGREQHAEGRLKLMLALSCQEKCLQRPGREATVNSRRRQEGNASQRRQNCADPPRLPVGWHAPRLGWHPSSGLPTGSREGQQR